MAVLALHGASTVELDQATAWAQGVDRAFWAVAVDGGLYAWRRLGRRPDLYVGDGDSVNPPRGIESIVYPRDKDFSDLAGALLEVRRRGASVVVVAGVSGGRLDQEWANLLELSAQARGFRGLLAPAGRGWAVITAGSCTLDTKPGRVFSLFAMNGPCRLSLAGARWGLQAARLTPGSRGLSNVSRTHLRLAVTSGTACLVFPAKA